MTVGGINANVENAGEGLNLNLSASEQAKLQMEVDTFNKSLIVEGRQTHQELGKDDFLKLLITQLSNQDPTSPMDNTQFIAQMAQFSSLEQITNMNAEFSKMNSMLTSNSALNTLGKTVDIDIGDATTTGVVEAVSSGNNPQVMVNGMLYDLNRVRSVYGN